METSSVFRMRLRKGNGEGVTKKGPLVRIYFLNTQTTSLKLTKPVLFIVQHLITCPTIAYLLIKLGIFILL